MMKRLGSASQPMEERIEQVIRDAAVFRGGVNVTYCPVSGGLSNENWRVKEVSGIGDWFVKVPVNGT